MHNSATAQQLALRASDSDVMFVPTGVRRRQPSTRVLWFQVRAIRHSDQASWTYYLRATHCGSPRGSFLDASDHPALGN